MAPQKIPVRNPDQVLEGDNREASLAPPIDRPPKYAMVSVPQTTANNQSTMAKPSGVDWRKMGSETARAPA